MLRFVLTQQRYLRRVGFRRTAIVRAVRIYTHGF